MQLRTFAFRLLVAGTAISLLPLSAQAQFELPNQPPVPFARPYAPVDANMTTGSVSQALATQATQAAPRPVVTNPQSVAQLKSGLDALGRGDVARARAARDTLPANSLDRRILMWAIAISGGDAVRSNEIAEAGQQLAGWPGMATLRSNSERALYRENPGPGVVLQAFGNTMPQTLEGAILLARAHMAVGKADAARAVIAPFWRKERMEASDEAAIIREFGRLIPAADHWARMEQMLHHDRIGSAERVAGLAGGGDLVRAWASVIRGEGGAGRLLNAVPQNQRKAGWYFAKARHERRAGNYREAAQTMLSAPREAAAYVDGDAWWIERRVLSRELLDLGDAQSAYRIAAAHVAESPVNSVDAEFHAGWYALRFLNDPRTAARHFQEIVRIAEGPISLSRGHYWLGRAAEAGAGGNARDHYARAAQFGTAYYGQLAAAKLGRNAISASYPSPTESDRLNFERREAVQAIRRLEAAGHPTRAASLYRSLATELSSLGELALLAVMAERQGNHMLALRVGKWAAGRGMEVGALAHPVGAIPSNANISGAGKALAYAIARQESEFNISARSGAGALGLLQLLPGTARDMARKTGLSFSQEKLTRDPGYNATLGAAYLQEQLDRFAGSYILTFAGYNAGPSRSQQWIERYGDPRGKSIDQVVDWVERIPFHETRGYVQRVMENYQVYKMRLSGQVDVVSDLTRGRL
jgi:soluble lytic murein transglycosylase